MAITTGRSDLGRAMAWLGLIALALGAWLSFPRARADVERAPLAVLIVDVSKSVVAPRPGFAPWIRAALIDAARHAESAHEDVCVVAFGASVRTIAAPRSASQLAADLTRASGSNSDPVRALLSVEAPSGEVATRLARALELVRSIARDRTRARIVVFGDGSFTGRDPASIAAELSQGGATFESVVAPRAERTDFGVSRLAVPRLIEEGRPLVVSCEAWLTAGNDARDVALSIEFERRDARGTETRALTVAAPNSVTPDASGCVRWPIHVDLGRVAPGAVVVHARVLLRTKAGARIEDSIPENDASTALLRCGGTLAIALVGGAEDRAQFLRAVGDEHAGIDFVAVDRDTRSGSSTTSATTPASLSLASALAQVDAVVSVDAVLDSMDAAADTALLESFVKRGGGWLDLAGWNWIAAHARAPNAGASSSRTPLGALDLARSGEERDVVFLVDASGSMSGAPFESVQTALAALVAAAPASDHLEARFFSGEIGPSIDLGSGDERADATSRRALVERLRTAREPHGSTALWSALDTLARERVGAKREALVVLLTDGRDPDRVDLAQHGARVRAALTASRAQLAVFAAGPDVDRELLTSLLSPNEALVEAPDLAKPDAAKQLARLFERELSRSSVRSGTALAIERVRAAPDSLASALTAMNDTKWPTLERFAHARATEGAEIVATADQGEPVAAIARRGLGLVAALAFVPASDAAPAWRARGDVLVPILRAIAGARRAVDEPRLREEDREIVLDGVGLDFPARVTARIVGTDTTVVFEAGRNGRDPVHERSASREDIADLDRAGLDAPNTTRRDRGVDSNDVDSSAVDSSDVLRFAFDVRGDPLELALERPRAEEFSRAPGVFVAPAAASGAVGTPNSSRSAHPAAPFTLFAALAMLTWAAFLGAFSRRAG